MNRYFLDTEFVDDGTIIMPVSLGIVRDDDDPNSSLYIEFAHDHQKARDHDFVRANVLPHLIGEEELTQEQARSRILDFLGLPAHPAESQSVIEFWAYYAAYDWVLFCHVFGEMVDLPPGLPQHCMDLQQWWVQLGSPTNVKPPKPAKAHNALADADWNRTFHGRLVLYERWFHGGVGRDPIPAWSRADAGL